MRRLLAVIVLSIALDARVAGETASFAIPFFEVEELKVSGGIAVGRFASLIDERSLYVLQLSDGRVLARIDRVGRAPFGVGGQRLVYIADGTVSVIGVDLESNQREELWKIPAGSRVLAIDVVERSVQITVEDSEGVRSRWSTLLTTGQRPDERLASREFVVRPERRDGRLFLRVAAVESAVPPTAPTAPPLRGVPGHARDESAERSLAWLERQLSQPFVSRHSRTARLIDSYEDTQRAGWIYDAALATIVFTAAGDVSTASQLLAGLEHLQREDGSWISSFHPDIALPRGTDRYVGAMAWVVMAANFFESDTHDARYAAMARRGLTYLESHRISETGSELLGAFRMGPSRPTAISTEHNADCYSAFLWRGRLDGNQRYLTVANEVRAFMLRQLWVEPSQSLASDGHFRVGVGVGGFYLDAQTWTSLALGEDPRDARYEPALRSAEQRLRVNTGRLGAVHNIVGFDESDDSKPEKAWAEGSEGMVAAFLAIGDVASANRYHAETARYQSESGGIPYATENRIGWATAPSVAATGWFVLNSLVPARNPFNPGFRSTQ
jgi:hypothetical protein